MQHLSFGNDVVQRGRVQLEVGGCLLQGFPPGLGMVEQGQGNIGALVQPVFASFGGVFVQHVRRCHLRGQPHFPVGIEQLHLSDFLEVHAHRIVGERAQRFILWLLIVVFVVLIPTTIIVVNGAEDIQIVQIVEVWCGVVGFFPAVVKVQIVFIFHFQFVVDICLACFAWRFVCRATGFSLRHGDPLDCRHLMNGFVCGGSRSYPRANRSWDSSSTNAKKTQISSWSEAVFSHYTARGHKPQLLMT